MMCVYIYNIYINVITNPTPTRSRTCSPASKKEPKLQAEPKADPGVLADISHSMVCVCVDIYFITLYIYTYSIYIYM